VGEVTGKLEGSVASRLIVGLDVTAAIDVGTNKSGDKRIRVAIMRRVILFGP
jgi:hypothetical protein